MKRLLFVLIIFTLLFNFPASAYVRYDAPYTLLVNSNIIKTEGNSIVYDTTAYAPVRFFLNAIGIYDIHWDDLHRSVTFTCEDKTVTLFEGNSLGLINEETVYIGGGVVLRNERILVPVRFIAELFGFYIEWDPVYYNANLIKEGVTVNDSLIEKAYTLEDLTWLYKIIEAESKGEPFEGKLAVGSVIMNRVKHPSFPNTIKEVIFDTAYGVQFQPIRNNSIYNTPSLDSVIAGKLAANGARPVGDSLYFLNPKTASSYWILRTRVFYKSINNHDFYR